MVSRSGWHRNRGVVICSRSPRNKHDAFDDDDEMLMQAATRVMLNSTDTMTYNDLH